MSVTFLTVEDKAKLTQLDLIVSLDGLMNEHALKRYSEEKVVIDLKDASDVDPLRPFTRLLLDMERLHMMLDEQESNRLYLEHQNDALKQSLITVVKLMKDMCDSQVNIQYELQNLECSVNCI